MGLNLNHLKKKLNVAQLLNFTLKKTLREKEKMRDTCTLPGANWLVIKKVNATAFRSIELTLWGQQPPHHCFISLFESFDSSPGSYEVPKP